MMILPTCQRRDQIGSLVPLVSFHFGFQCFGWSAEVWGMRGRRRVVEPLGKAWGTTIGHLGLGDQE